MELPLNTRLFYYSAKRNIVDCIYVSDVDGSHFYFYVNDDGWKAPLALIGKKFFFSFDEVVKAFNVKFKDPPGMTYKGEAQSEPPLPSCSTCVSSKNGSCWGGGSPCEDYRYCASRSLADIAYEQQQTPVYFHRDYEPWYLST